MNRSKRGSVICSDMSSASNSLAREFLSDVSHLCNAVDQRVEGREEEEEKTHIAALGQYLIQGRGFILLTKLNSIIDQELTCREDLLTLLLSLLPLVWKIPVDKEKAIDFNLPFSVEICLTKETTLSSLKLTQEKQNIGENVHLSAQASGKLNTSWKNRRQRKTTHRYSSAASNPIYFSQAMDLVHEFIQQQGFKLFEITAIQMEGLCARDTEVNTEASECLKVLINSIMKIISTIKKVKSEQLHQSVCTRKRHRRFKQVAIKKGVCLRKSFRSIYRLYRYCLNPE
ncbi:lysosomal-trafficking regulator [Crotalus adamanteus]|uniref:Lysosomal-trafficking regulator n=1 Tax=Crotalus adamanteus TaxID=8729 RepID=A0AAW1CBP2_CROAD